MSGRLETLGRGRIDALILQALVRTLLAKGVLSADDIRALLLEAAMQLDVLGSEVTPQSARSMVESDLAPVFLGESPGS